MDPTPPVKSKQQPKQYAGEPIAAVSGLVGGEQLTSTANDSATAPEASEVMVGPAIRPPSPQVVPPTLAEDDEVEEIEREEPRAQSVRILRKHDDDIVIVEEEDTTKEFRRLETSLTGVMKQIKVSALSRKVMVDVWN